MRENDTVWARFYRDGASLQDICEEFKCSVYDLSPWLYAPLLKDPRYDVAASAIPDDVFKAEAQRRVTRFSPDEYMSPNQSDDRAKLDVARSRTIELNTACIREGRDNPELRELAALFDKLDSMHGNPLPKRAQAINTTMPGRENEVNTDG